jgi:hypothetical protein
MTAVIAAILAAFLAGGVALFREHRLQQRRLLVAARVTYATFRVATNGIKTSLNSDSWAPFNLLPGKTSLSETWDSYKGDLAGHLTWPEWRWIEESVNHYLALTAMSQSESPKESHSVLDSTRAMLEKARQELRPYCVYRLSAWKLVRRWITTRKQRKELKDLW